MKPGRPEEPGVWERIRDWRLPVRYKVPPRNDLIAFALMALAFGLMVGLAIAPGWGNAGSARAVIGLPTEEADDSGATGVTGTTVAALQPPAGGESTSTGNGGGAGSTPVTPSGDSTVTSTPITTGTDTGDDGSDTPTTPTDNNDNYSDPPASEEPSDPGDEEPGLSATVVGADNAGYAVADSAGNLLYIHYPNPASTEPKVGKRIATDIQPVDNGTFVQSDALESKGSASSSKLSGVVSFIDPDSGVITVSSRGVSVAVNAEKAMEKSASPPVLGSWVTGTIDFPFATGSRLVGTGRRLTDRAPRGAANSTPSISPQSEEEPIGEQPVEEEPVDDETSDDPADDPVEEEPITIPAITVKSIEATGDPLTQIEMTGPVSWDSETRQLTISADGFGVLNREVVIGVLKKMALKGIEDGLNYAASIDLGTSGALSLAGLSANFSLDAAGDPKQAFGTHTD